MARRVTRKLFEHEGSSYTLGRLSFEQKEKVGSAVIQKNELVLISLQNGEPDENWTVEKIKTEFDEVGFDFMFADVIEFNGIKWKVVAPGEEQAAESTSSNSVAESSQG